MAQGLRIRLYTLCVRLVKKSLAIRLWLGVLAVCGELNEPKGLYASHELEHMGVSEN